MRDGNAISDAGGAKFFAFEDGGDDGFFVCSTEGACVAEAGGHFADDIFLTSRFEVWQNGFFDDEFGKFHEGKLRLAEG
ncbi:MAG: hypothetical protein RLZZ458_3029 [Planctomycetota bacterium]